MANLTRRDFLKFVNYTAATIGLGAVVGPVIAYFFPANLEETPSDPVLVGNVGELHGLLGRYGGGRRPGATGRRDPRGPG